LLSQPVSIFLSLELKTVPEEYENYDLKSIPYLNITYYNHTDSALYFPKISTNKNGFPRIISLSTGGNILNSLKSIDELKDYSSDKYKVIICEGSWDVMEENVDEKSSHTTSILSEILSNIYEILEKDSTTNLIEEQHILYNSNEITEANIEGEFKDKFVFLDIGQEYRESYNLFAFQLIGGNYCFKLADNIIDPNIITDFKWDENQKSWVHNNTPLPLKVGRYILFSGVYLTNEVGIQMDKPMLNK
jgi:hypothetical protein